MTTLSLYRGLIRNHDCPWCWACGRDGSFVSKPPGWFAPWFLERSHIVNKPRIEDRRLVVILCPLCHASFHGQRIVTPARSLGCPRLELAHLLWLKQTFDLDFFEVDFLQQHSVRALPVPAPTPQCYRLEYQYRRGDVPEVWR